MMKLKPIYEIFKCNTVIYKLINQQINYPVNIAYKLMKLKKEFDEIELLMNNRWVILFGENYDETKFTNNQIEVYNTTLQATIEIDTYDLAIENIINNEDVKLTIEDLEILNKFLTQ